METTDISSKCSDWLEKCSVSENYEETASCKSDFSSYSDLSITTNNSAMKSGFSFTTDEPSSGNLFIENNDCVSTSYHSPQIILQQKRAPKISKINIYKSRKIHIGDVNYIQGTTVIINNAIPAKPDEEIDKQENTRHPVSYHIITRRCWLAQPPLEIKHMTGPAENIIICHSATEEAVTQSENTLLVRLIQSFHMDSRNWSDIGYNFLIGGDGSIFEGRGWNVIGAHTIRYNSSSIGICFIGTFIRKKPTENALNRARHLIEYGISIGAVSENYSLLGHCQCIGTASPGEALFQEIKTWNKFNESVSVVKNPHISEFSLENSEVP